MGRRVFYMQTRKSVAQFTDRLSPMSVAVIKKSNHMSTKMPKYFMKVRRSRRSSGFGPSRPVGDASMASADF